MADLLAAKGHRVLAFDHRQHAEAMRHPYPPGTEIVLGDVRDAEAVHEAMSHADAWIHLAAVLGTQETIRDPRPAAVTNVMGGLNVLEAAAALNCPGCYIAVGNHWMNNPYSITKTCIERFCDMYRRERGVRVNVVRGMNAYGPRQRAAPPFAGGRVRKIMPAFVCRALSGLPVEVYGDGQQVSDMIWVGDMAAALVAATEAAMAGTVLSHPIEAGPIEHNTINEVADLVVAAVVALGRSGVPVVHLPMRPGEQPGARVVANTGTLAAIRIDPAEFVPLTEGIRLTVEWFAENENVTWRRPNGR